MKVTMNFNHLEPTNSIKEVINKKSEKLTKFFNGNFDINWTCSVEKDSHIAHISINGARFNFNSHASSGDLYKSIDMALDKISKQLQGKKEKSYDHIHHNKKEDLYEN